MHPRQNYTAAHIMHSTQSNMKGAHKTVDQRKQNQKTKWYEPISVLFTVSEAGNIQHSQKKVTIISL